jgi:hypothetical protein
MLFLGNRQRSVVVRFNSRVTIVKEVMYVALKLCEPRIYLIIVNIVISKDKNSSIEDSMMLYFLSFLYLRFEVFLFVVFVGKF